MPTAADQGRAAPPGEAARCGMPCLTPTAKVLYLGGTGLVLFLLASPVALAAVLGLNGLLWLASGHSLRGLVRAVRRVLAFAALLMGTALVFGDGWKDGLIQALRLLGMVLASALVQRNLGAQDFVAGLTRLGIPRGIATAVEVTLGLVTGSRGPGAAGGAAGVSLRRLLRGESGFLAGAITEAVRGARTRVEPLRGPGRSESAEDLAVICGVALVSAGIRLLRVAPGLPVAPGHKGVVLIPLYVAAGVLTRSPWGATQAGAVMGITAFLTGDGRFGIFEIPKFLAPGLVVDALLPRLGPAGGVGRFGYGALGLLAALSRFSTIVAVALFVGAPAGFFALLVPVGIAHAVFGALSGLVTPSLVRALHKAAGTDPRGQPPGGSP